MNNKLSWVVEAVKEYIGGEELSEWWQLVINEKLNKYNWSLSNSKQVGHYFNALKRFYRVERRVVYVGRKPFIYYSVKKKVVKN
ncbi:MAG: hypothetical protein HY376_03165 [Candidatus Blackburnbacteria bacterium]|nr:hypothetical protein [Candidatus Blackburnbacteria bacterium]